PDDLGPARPHLRESPVQWLLQGLIGYEYLGSGVLEDERVLRRGQARIQGDEDGAGAWNGEVRLEHRSGVRQERRDPVALADVELGLQRAGEGADALM